MTLRLPDIIDSVRNELQQPFPPGEDNQAHYSDTNDQLPGGIIERAIRSTLAGNVETLFVWPRRLKSTYLYQARTDRLRPQAQPLKNGNETPDMPEAMGSPRLDEGILSTIAEEPSACCDGLFNIGNR